MHGYNLQSQQLLYDTIWLTAMTSYIYPCYTLHLYIHYII